MNMYILITINLQIKIFSIKSTLRSGLLRSLNWLRRDACNSYENLYDEKKREY